MRFWELNSVNQNEDIRAGYKIHHLGGAKMEGKEKEKTNSSKKTCKQEGNSKVTEWLLFQCLRNWSKHINNNNNNKVPFACLLNSKEWKENIKILSMQRFLSAWITIINKCFFTHSDKINSSWIKAEKMPTRSVWLFITRKVQKKMRVATCRSKMQKHK